MTKIVAGINIMIKMNTIVLSSSIWLYILAETIPHQSSELFMELLGLGICEDRYSLSISRDE